DVADYRRQLQVPFQQLLAALLLRGAHLDQLAPVTGVRAQPADLLRRHEAAGQRPLLGDLRQPDGVQQVGLRPPGQRLDLRCLARVSGLDSTRGLQGQADLGKGSSAEYYPEQCPGQSEGTAALSSCRSSPAG